ncbi:hypothetical protein CN97_05290 [Haematobacter massiliensis]|uniref:Uncharacterized protein n=1 Tax=Haematobacter massiliensis TaxID=195105 RepID=A0A086YD74_9RHOB|nr:hypothetical protein [Haematobacter massiliensis]KFI32224.1 hypothetical protein CN97_05290 [Haematobacter massiliensis]
MAGNRSQSSVCAASPEMSALMIADHRNQSAWCDENTTCNPLGMAKGKVECDIAAHGDAKNNGATDAEFVKQIDRHSCKRARATDRSGRHAPPKSWQVRGPD